MSNVDWPEYENGVLETLSERHLFVQGFLGRSRLGRAMSLLRLADGRVVIHNAVCLDEAGMARLEAFGPPALLIVPSAMHRTDAARYKARYPALQVLCPEGCRARVERRLAVDGTYADFPDDPHVRVEYWEGTGRSEGVFSVDEGEGLSLLTCDAIFNLPHQAGCAGLIVKWIGSSGGPRVTPLAKRAMVKDPVAFAAHLRRLAELPGLKRVLVQHREPIEGDVRGVLEGIASRL